MSPSSRAPTAARPRRSLLAGQYGTTFTILENPFGTTTSDELDVAGTGTGHAPLRPSPSSAATGGYSGGTTLGAGYFGQVGTTNALGTAAASRSSAGGAIVIADTATGRRPRPLTLERLRRRPRRRPPGLSPTATWTGAHQPWPTPPSFAVNPGVHAGLHRGHRRRQRRPWATWTRSAAARSQLNAANTYTGQTVVSGGTLVASGGTAVPSRQ